MGMGLTKYGRPQVVIFPAIVVVLIAAGVLLRDSVPAAAFYTIEAILAIVLIWILSFFRDPARTVPADPMLLISPADGTVTDIEMVQDNAMLGGPALRIGIFLSIFNVHINRSPCKATVEKIAYKPGKFKNAMGPESGKVNESNDLLLMRTDEPRHRLVVRQISGAIARRIVCEIGEGGQLAAGEKFGMIKFGSRTELYIPADQHIKPLVETGDKVKAGLTPLVRYDHDQNPAQSGP